MPWLTWWHSCWGPVIRPETRRRARAFQLLYAWETQGRPPLDRLIAGFGRLVRPAPAELDAAADLALEVARRVEQLDQIVGRAVEHWRLERIGVPERLILRLAAWELVDGATPPRVVIDQALWLAHRFAGESAAPFVNGVLDRVARDLGRL